MKKRVNNSDVKRISIEISKKNLYTIGIIIIFLIGVSTVVAFGSSPAVNGHSYSELQTCGNGMVLMGDTNGNWYCSNPMPNCGEGKELQVVGGHWACVASGCRYCLGSCGNGYNNKGGSLATGDGWGYNGGCAGQYQQWHQGEIEYWGLLLCCA